MMPALVAMKRMVAARMPTQGPRIQRSQATLSGRKRTMPSTGSARKLLPSWVPYSLVTCCPSTVSTSPVGSWGGMTMVPSACSSSGT